MLKLCRRWKKSSWTGKIELQTTSVPLSDILCSSQDFDVTAPPDKTPFWIANAALFLMFDSIVPLSDIHRYNELRLLIRHPSMGRLSPSPTFFAESLSICAEASRNILAIINRFRDFRQLECHPQVIEKGVAVLTTAECFYDCIG